LCQLRFTDDELDYLGRLRFIKSDFIDFLGLFHLPENSISIEPAEAQGEIDITITGSWLHTVLFEIPVLAIVNEVYFRHCGSLPPWEEGRQRLHAKIDLVRSDPTARHLRVADYGTRR